MEFVHATPHKLRMADLLPAEIPAAEQELRRRLAVNVRSARTAAGLSLKRASERAQMFWRHWQKVEAAEVNVTLQTLVRLGTALTVDPAALIREPPKEGARRDSTPPRG